MAEKKGTSEEIDFVFARYPLWIRYSGLPQKIGPVAWCVFQRLLELRYRFDSTKFFYPMEKLCGTTGIERKWNMKKILERLEKEQLIKWKTAVGRGKATEYEIIEPLNTPILEETIYQSQPRLRSKSFKRGLESENGNKKDSERALSSSSKEKDSPGALSIKEKDSERALSLEEKGSKRDLLGEEKDSERAPIKKIYIKRQQQQKDPSHEEGLPGEKEQIGDEPHQGEVVVAFSINNLKEYGISGEDAEKWLKKYSLDFLCEKIEIIEYKKFSGEQIRNVGGMLKKAIEGDWQPPEGFTTRAQREEIVRKEKEARENTARSAREKEEQETREREMARAVEEWKKTASEDVKKKIKEQARREVVEDMPTVEERYLGTLIKLRENKIIVEEWLPPPKSRGS